MIQTCGCHFCLTRLPTRNWRAMFPYHPIFIETYGNSRKPAKLMTPRHRTIVYIHSKVLLRHRGGERVLHDCMKYALESILRKVFHNSESLNCSRWQVIPEGSLSSLLSSNLTDCGYPITWPYTHKPKGVPFVSAKMLERIFPIAILGSEASQSVTAGRNGESRAFCTLPRGERGTYYVSSFLL